MTKLQQLTKFDIQFCTDRRVPPNLLEIFNRDTAGHEMDVLHNDGLYRHLQFTTPGHGNGAFQIVTCPGLLTITGDMGTFSFSQISDMFDYFRGAFKPERWATKVVNGASGGAKEVSEFSNSAFKQWLLVDHVESLDEYSAAVVEEWRSVLDVNFLNDNAQVVGTASEAAWLLDQLELPEELEEHYNAASYSSQEWDVFSFQFAWCAAAILTAIRTFGAHLLAAGDYDERQGLTPTH